MKNLSCDTRWYTFFEGSFNPYTPRYVPISGINTNLDWKITIHFLSWDISRSIYRPRGWDWGTTIKFGRSIFLRFFIRLNVVTVLIHVHLPCSCLISLISIILFHCNWRRSIYWPSGWVLGISHLMCYHIRNQYRSLPNT